MSLLLAFSTLYPEAQFLVLYIIPIKAKWLAWFDAALIIFDIFSCLGQRQYLLALVPVVALLNYLAFFWDDLMEAAGRKAKHRSVANRRTIDLKTARKQMEKQGYLHKCAVCGRTDTDFPDLEFRYCSRCAGYHCFCSEHIFSHEHFTQ